VKNIESRAEQNHLAVNHSKSLEVIFTDRRLHKRSFPLLPQQHYPTSPMYRPSKFSVSF